MQTLINKTVLLLCSIALALGNFNLTIYLVAFALGTTSFSSLGYLFEKKLLRYGFFLSFCMIGQFYPLALYFLPVLCYDIFCYPSFILPSIGLLALFLQYPVLELDFLILLLLCVISFLVSKKELKIITLQHSFRQLQDDKTELQLFLNSKNKELLEKYDTDIRIATLDERNRIAGEIHDNVGHLLTSSILQIGALLSSNPPQSEALNTIQATLTTGMGSIRSSIHNLHDKASNLYDDTSAILNGSVKCECNLQYDIENQPARQIHHCFALTLKEAISNVNKHSNATELQIILREHPAFYQLIISDNGTVDKASVQNPIGIGIQTMRERVEALSGVFTINTDKGFQIFISIPKELM